MTSPPPSSDSAHTHSDRKISYTRDFLLSFSNLDICKKLPSGVDKSVLSELGDDSGGVFEWQRSGARRSEYVAPPNRVEGGGGYSRGRWDTQSSGSDGDQQLDVPDSGKRFGNPSRRSWQQTEHDGLLGSGAFPRPSSGHVGPSALKTRGNSNYQTNKSTEPYQPPRPYKAAPYSRKDGTDSINDETFGSTECSNEDRAEEERKRRASFELMRKEQQKALQEKQTQIPAREKLDTNIAALLDTSKERSIQSRTIKLDDSELLVSQKDPSRTSQTQAPVSRPLVPPGFANALTEKNVYTKSSSTTLGSEARGTVENDLNLSGVDHVKESRNHSATSADIIIQKNDLKSISRSIDASGTITASSNMEGNMCTGAFKTVSSEALGHDDANEVREGVVFDFSNKKEALGLNHSTSLLEKFFGSSLPSSSTNFVEYQDVKIEEEEPAPSKTSKFAQWFIEDEKKPAEDSSHKDLLSLVTNNGTVGSQPINSINTGTEQNPVSKLSGNKNPVAELLQLGATSSLVGTPQQYHAADKINSNSGFLTCEDLERSMMAQVEESSSTLQQSMKGSWSDAKLQEEKAEVGNPGTQILSLLRPGGKELSPLTGLADKHASVDSSAMRNSDMVDSTEKTLTLGEAFFGSAFMNQLQSAEAPLSVKRGLDNEAPGMHATEFHGSTLPHADDSFLSSAPVGYQTSQNIHEGSSLAPHQTQEGKTLRTTGQLSRYGDSAGDVGFIEGVSEIQLPEESIFCESSLFEQNANTEFGPEKAMELLNGRSHHSMIRGGVHLSTNDLGGHALARGHYNMANSDNVYDRSNSRQPMPIPHQLNQSHLAPRNPAMNFMSPENVHFDPHNLFPTNVPRHNFNMNSRPGFDHFAHHQMQQHMPLPPNLPLNHSIQGLPRGVHQSRHINHVPGYLPEMNNVNNYSMLNRQPNFGGPGTGIPGGPRETHPELLERFMEMRANSNQNHPNSGGHNPGSYNPDMNFRYRGR